MAITRTTHLNVIPSSSGSRRIRIRPVYGNLTVIRNSQRTRTPKPIRPYGSISNKSVERIMMFDDLFHILIQHQIQAPSPIMEIDTIPSSSSPLKKQEDSEDWVEFMNDKFRTLSDEDYIKDAIPSPATLEGVHAEEKKHRVTLLTFHERVAKLTEWVSHLHDTQ